jgi:hypothetical protein
MVRIQQGALPTGLDCSAQKPCLKSFWAAKLHRLLGAGCQDVVRSISPAGENHDRGAHRPVITPGWGHPCSTASNRLKGPTPGGPP